MIRCIFGLGDFSQKKVKCQSSKRKKIDKNFKQTYNSPIDNPAKEEGNSNAEKHEHDGKNTKVQTIVLQVQIVCPWYVTGKQNIKLSIQIIVHKFVML